jgi:adenosylmethionine-8-amino-7-oxononanoate aminotransferase
MHTALGQRSRLVSVDQGGHGVYLLTPNVCANNTVTAYFANGAFPSSDISCPANASTAAATQQTTTDQTHELAVREIIHRMRP